MKDRLFFDTNALIYLYSNENKKQSAIRILLEEDADIFISRQVIHEFCNVLIKKLKYSPLVIREVLIDFNNNFKVLELDHKLTHLAINMFEKYKYSFYDSMILAAALTAKCSVLYSEDLQHGQSIESRLTIINPFK